MGVKTDARDAVRKWFTRNAEKRWSPIRSLRHVHARATVVGYAAPRCLIVRRDWRESEAHLREWNRDNPLDIIHFFDPRLREGDACYTAYVSCDSIGQPVAVRAPTRKRAATKQPKR